MAKKSFTLLEMLVVIAIMCILVALLGPAYAQVRATASLTKCINNKKHLAASMLIYGNENDSTIIYKGTDYTYADVMAGLPVNNNLLTREYMPERELHCTLAKEVVLDEDAEKATGMLNALNIANRTNSSTSSPSGNWLENETDKNYEVHGLFAKIVDTNSQGKSGYCGVFYMLDRMRHPEDLVLFADTFKISANNGDSYWSFIPNAEDNNAMVTMAHRNRAAVAFADGHADSMDRGKLRDSKTQITKFANDEFKQDKFSD